MIEMGFVSKSLTKPISIMEGRVVTMTTALDVLRAQFTQSCEKLDGILAGIDDAEFFWEPVAGCWTLHRRGEKRAASADGRGEWVLDYVLPEPKPAPVTTIAWRTAHIAAVNYLYWDYAFGPANASFDLEFPDSAAATLNWLRASHHPVAVALSTVGDADRICRTNWGDEWPAHRIFATLVNEQVHHGAEISLLRDLYRNRRTLGGA